MGKAIDHVKKNIPKYIAKGKAAINGALDKAKGWLKGALKKAKATFGEMDVEISDEDELEWGFIKTTIDKVKKALPKYVAKGKSAILGALDKVKAGVRGALKKAKAKFGEEEMDVEVFDTDKVKWGFIKKAIDHVKKNIPKYIAKGKAAINGALDKAKGWLKGALKKAKATFGEDEMDLEISDEDELEWGFIRTTIDKVKKALPKYVAKGKSAILGALDKVKAGVRGALK